MLIFFRKVPDMGLNGTLGYNMNLLTELSELLVESSPAYALCPQKNAVLVDGMTPGYIGQENCLYMEMKLLMFD